ncbi:MAG: protein kinase [Planctomycetales bacterium]|nr:protein kinase [Planctomycetales bacterium]
MSGETRAPRRFGPWEVLAELGRGGYGTVYRARHERTGSLAALKVLEGPGTTPEEVRRFQREIALARTLDHPGIVRVLDVGEGSQSEEGRAHPPTVNSERGTVNCPWFAMDLIEGRPLWAILAEEQLPWRRAVEIAREVADALAHAHSRGVLHRDVKPGNVLVGRKASDEDVMGGPPRNAQRAFLTDFGLARLATTGSRLTRTGMALGTPEYMSPEQAQGERDKLGPPTDVWGLGCVLYETLAGRTPFGDTLRVAPRDSLDHVVERVVRNEAVPIRRLRSDVPPTVERVLRVCLAKRPRDRYRDGAALRDDLDRVLQGGQPRGRPPARRLRLVIVAAVGLAGAVGGLHLRGMTTIGAGPGPFLGAADPENPPPDDPVPALLRRAHESRPRSPGEAAAFLARAIEALPGDRSLRLERADCLREAGRWREAAAEYGRLLEGVPGDMAARFGRGLTRWLAAFAWEKGMGGAMGDLERAVPGLPPERAALARAILASFDQRWEEMEASLAGAGDRWEARLVRAMLRHHQGEAGPEDQEKAVQDFTKAIESGPPHAWAFYERGHARSLLGDLPGAIEDYTRSLALRPGNGNVLYARGIARGKLPDLAGAEEDFTAALGAEGGFAEAFVNRGVVREALGNPAGALEDYRAAVGVRPDLPEAQAHLGLRLHEAGAWSDAASALHAFLRLAPDDPWAERARQLLADCEARPRSDEARGR